MPRMNEKDATSKGD